MAFEMLLDVASEYEVVLKPAVIVTDFEKAVINAAREIFPSLQFTRRVRKCIEIDLCVLIETGKIIAEKIVCYVGTWAVYRPGRGGFGIEHIDPFLCTHLMYSFFGINEDGTLRIIDPYLDLEENWGRGHIKRFNALKAVNPALKTIAAVGGWNEGSVKFSNVAGKPALRQRFIQDAVAFCRKYDFDGVDLDWEYPAQRGGNEANDKENHALWLEEMRKVFDRKGLLLSAAVASAEFSSGTSYDIPRVAAALHFINVMTYDMHGAWENTCGLNAPLYGGPADVSELQKQLNVNASIHYWLSQGAPKEKLVLGIPLYGRSFTLANPAVTDIGAAVTGPGMAGQYSREPGVLGYNEFCELRQQEQWKIWFSDEQQAYYATKGNQWLGFEDKNSLALKMKFLLDLDLGGAMVWSLESDDFHGLCSTERYPLMNVIYAALRNGALPPTSAPPSSSTTRTTTTTSAPGTGSDCTAEGMFPNPDNCQDYYICTGEGHRYDFTCPKGLLFDPVINNCNWPEQVDCQTNNEI
ncbi:chitinase-3-like protein 1 [Sabethes cyaneus]|uniref:chitinase-3-like protein 1 n=1 Tax=Sabethes cyaneus TaxID=53552 RepID=UPI00237D4E77|nr:chitinase-3-like protein 1 [Sabethes cyaneus]